MKWFDVNHLKKLAGKFYSLLGYEISKSKFTGLEHCESDRFAYHVQNLSMCFFLVFSILYFADVHFNHANISQIFIKDVLDVRYLKYLQDGQIKLFYVFSTLLAVPLSFFWAVLFYAKNGHKIERRDLFKTIFFNEYLSTIVGIIVIPMVTFGFYAGGYLMARRYPEAIGISKVPLFVVLQIFVCSKALSYTTAGISGFVLMLLPYSMHPLRFVEKKP